MIFIILFALQIPALILGGQGGVAEVSIAGCCRKAFMDGFTASSYDIPVPKFHIRLSIAEKFILTILNKFPLIDDFCQEYKDILVSKCFLMDELLADFFVFDAVRVIGIGA